MSEKNPREIVAELDKHIIGQEQAKRAVAIALRNRWRRMQLEEPLRGEITPKNILMIGPTGVGKTEIARRLAKLANAPFIKVEATKFTEVGYVGRDVESIIRDLLDVSLKMMREQAIRKVEQQAFDASEERILDALLPPARESEEDEEQEDDKDEIDKDAESGGGEEAEEDQEDEGGEGESEEDATEEDLVDQKTSKDSPTRQLFRKQLREGELDDVEIEIDINAMPVGVEIMAPPGMEEMTNQLQSLFSAISSDRNKRTRRLTVKAAMTRLKDEEASRLINEDELKARALEVVEQSGIVFIDELDKVAKRSDLAGADISREGVQRDLLPLIEGCTVNTRHGMINTDHILFITSGAFHLSKPSDLIPELQGRLPIRVELHALTPEEFVRILTEPNASLTEQYQALLKIEGLSLSFTKDGIRRIAEVAWEVNERTENIGARRLHTVMERLLDEASFAASDKKSTKLRIDAKYVNKQLDEFIKDEDLSRFIL